MPREFSRNQRLGAQMLRSLSELLRFETKDPGLADVSLTAVDLSRDLSVARVYFSLLNPDDDPQPAVDGLKRASGFLRSKLGFSPDGPSCAGTCALCTMTALLTAPKWRD